MCSPRFGEVFCGVHPARVFEHRPETHERVERRRAFEVDRDVDIARLGCLATRVRRFAGRGSLSAADHGASVRARSRKPAGVRGRTPGFTSRVARGRVCDRRDRRAAAVETVHRRR